MPDRPVLGLVGATGAIGRTVLDVLPTRPYVWGDIRLAAHPDDAGQRVQLGAEELTVEALSADFFDGIDIALFDIPEPVTPEWVRVALDKGCRVIDNSTVHRLADGVPLVVPEINADAVLDAPLGIIATPGATVLTMIDVLHVLHQNWGLSELVVTTLQAASGRGRVGMNRLYDELEVVAGNRELGQRPGDVRRLIEHELGPSVFPGPTALNVLPWVGRHAGDGWTTEEIKLRDETRKILGLPDLKVSVTCVRVPVISSHSLTVHATFARQIKIHQARQALIETPAIVVLDDPHEPDFPTPNDVVGVDPRFVGRLRQAIDFPRTLDLFIAGDNLRKGGALNMIQVAELVVARHFGSA